MIRIYIMATGIKKIELSTVSAFIYQTIFLGKTQKQWKIQQFSDIIIACSEETLYESKLYSFMEADD